jgi:uncharacterized protein
MPNGFVHVELNTDDVAKAKKFYRRLFKWKLKDEKMPGGVYTMINPGPRAVGGGMQVKPMPEAPNAWLPYVLVDDVKKSLAKARKLGANVVVDFMPIPGMGALGVFVDPSGAALGLWAPEMKRPRGRRRRK